MTKYVRKSTVVFRALCESNGIGDHFRKHGHKFGAATESDYERLAEQFFVWGYG
jgi:pyocin large subunit-like protein